MKKEVKSQLGIKSSCQECQDEKDVKSNWSTRPTTVDEIKHFNNDDKAIKC